MNDNVKDTENKDENKKTEEKESYKNDTFIYLDLDSILDTRIGTIAYHDSDLAARILNSGKYFNRNYDDFEGLDNKTFMEWYKARDSEVLPYSVLTNVSFLLKRLVKDSIYTDTVNPTDEHLVIHLNIHPYSLTEQEIEDMSMCMKYITMSYCSIVIIDEPMSALTPKLCKEKYDIMIMYDFQDWLILHGDDLARNRMPQVSLIVPKVYKGEKPTKESIDEILEGTKHDPFTFFEMILLPSINLKSMKTSLFCISEDLNAKTKDKIFKAISLTEEDIETAIDIINNKNNKSEITETVVDEDNLL